MFEKIKELSKETLIYGVSNIVGRFLNFLLVPFYTHVFAQSQFGEFSLVYAYLSFFNILFIYGMDAAFMKYSSIAQEKRKKTVFSTGILSVLISTTAFSLILFLIRDSFRELVKIDVALESIVLFVILILFLDTIALIPFANLRLENRPVKFAVIKTGNIIINLVLNIVLIVGYNYGIEAIFISNLAASAFSLAMLTPEIIRKLEFKISLPDLKQMLKFALPYLPGSFAAMLVQVIDVPIIELLTNKETLGLYRANYKIGIVIMLFVSMFNYAWQPFFLNNAKNADAKELFSKIFTIFLILVSFIWVILSLFVDEIVRYKLFGDFTIIEAKYHPGLFIVPVILLAYVFYGAYVNFTAGIYIKEKTKYFPVVTISAAIVNVVVNIIFVPRIGIMGGAIATLLSYIIMAVGLYLVSQKFYPIKYESAKVIKIFALLFITTTAYYYFYYNDMLSITLKLIMLTAFFTSFILLKIISINEVKLLYDKIMTGRKN